MALYVRECSDVTELMAGDNKVESLWVKTRGRSDKSDILVAVCYRWLNQDEEIDRSAQLPVISWRYRGKNGQLILLQTGSKYCFSWKTTFGKTQLMISSQATDAA